MTNGQVTMYGGCAYLEIQPPTRFTYTQRFCDEHGATARHPMAPQWPETMLTTVEFATEEPESTRVTVTWEPYNATEEEIAVFVKARAGMTLGWTGSFDKLEEVLSSEK